MKCRSDVVAPFAVRQAYTDEPDGCIAQECRSCGHTDHRAYWESKAGGSLDIILEEFSSCGYNCKWTSLNAVDFGVPQFRERLFIIGSRDAEFFEWPEPECGPSDDERQPRQGKLFARTPVTLNPWRTVKDTLWLQGHPSYGSLDAASAVLWVKNVVRPHDEPVTWPLDRPSPTVGAHQAAKLALAPYGVPPEQLARQQWHVLGRRQGDRPPVFVEHTYLSDDELLRLQTFPAAWYLFGTRMQRAFQIGNAVPPKLAEAVGKCLRRQTV
jgi:DNA (cytosine-5)-methyltransferase 1